MQSPFFPAMDPCIEGICWGDFHTEFISSWRGAIADQLPDGFDAEISECVSVVTPDERSRRVSPDVPVVRSDEPASFPAASPTLGQALDAVAVLEPLEIAFEFLERLRWPYIEIKRLAEGKVIAVLELLSPSNKSGEVRIEYLRKRESVFRSDAHLVELDLLLAGQRLPMCDNLPPGDYYAFVSRTDRRPICQVHGWELQRKLPVIPVPLVQPFADLQIDLSAVFATVFARGRYVRRLKYAQPPVAPIRPQVKEWVRSTAGAGAEF